MKKLLKYGNFSYKYMNWTIKLFPPNDKNHDQHIQNSHIFKHEFTLNTTKNVYVVSHNCKNSKNDKEKQ